MKTAQLTPHDFHSDGIQIAPNRPETGCTRCTQPEGNQVHDPVRVAAYQAELAARTAAIDRRYDPHLAD